MSEQLAKMEGDAARPLRPDLRPQSPPAQSPPAQAAADAVTARAITTSAIASKAGAPGRHGLAAGGVLRRHCPGLVGLWQRGQVVVARWAPQLVSTPSSPPEGPTLAAQSAPSIVQVAAAETAPPPGSTHRQRHRKQHPWPRLRPRRRTAAPAAARSRRASGSGPVAAKDRARSRDLERNIEQLKANQQQMASDNSKAIGELKASQEEMKRALAKVSEQTPPKASPPPAQPAPALRRPERTYQPPQARARPRYYPREWILRRLVAVGAVIDRNLVLQQRPTRYRARRTVWDAIEKTRLAQNRATPAIASHISPSSHPTCQFRKAGAACSDG